MKRYLAMVIMISAFIALVACGVSGDTSELPATQGNNLTDVAGEQPTEPTYECTDEELGEKEQEPYANLVDLLLFIYRKEDVDIESFDRLHTVDHTLAWEAYVQGEQMLIRATQPIHNVSLVHFSDDWDEAADELTYILIESFGIADTITPDEGIHILEYSSIGGSIPRTGISFYDAGGQLHFFAINHDNSDSPYWYMIWSVTDQMQL